MEWGLIFNHKHWQVLIKLWNKNDFSINHLLFLIAFVTMVNKYFELFPHFYGFIIQLCQPMWYILERSVDSFIKIRSYHMFIVSDQLELSYMNSGIFGYELQYSVFIFYGGGTKVNWISNFWTDDSIYWVIPGVINWL